MSENITFSKSEEMMSRGLSPQTIRVRDSLVEKYSTEPLDTLSEKLQALINDETETFTRLGVMAARVEILRMRLSMLTGVSHQSSTYNKDQPEISEEEESEEEEVTTDWMTLRIVEASEVNGVRFPEGIIIDVHIDDAKKLLESNKAELISVSSDAAKELLSEVENSDVNEGVDFVEPQADEKFDTEESKNLDSEDNKDLKMKKDIPLAEAMETQTQAEKDLKPTSVDKELETAEINDQSNSETEKTDVSKVVSEEKAVLNTDELENMFEKSDEEPKASSKKGIKKTDVPNTSEPVKTAEDLGSVDKPENEKEKLQSPEKKMKMGEDELDSMLQEFGASEDEKTSKLAVKEASSKPKPKSKP